MARERVSERNGYGGATATFELEKTRRKVRDFDSSGFKQRHGFKNHLLPLQNGRFNGYISEFFSDERRKVRRPAAGVDFQHGIYHPSQPSHGLRIFDKNRDDGYEGHVDHRWNRTDPAGSLKDKNQGHHPSSRLNFGWVGHRGVARLPWRRGPREPPSYRLGPNLDSLITLFVDYIPRGLPPVELRKIFEKEGKVIDVFISRKSRPQKNYAFGFVRFESEAEAKRAILHVNGFEVDGMKLKIAVAKYNKVGRPFDIHGARHIEARPKANRRIKNPSFRDNRKYSEVLLGRKKEVMEPGKMKMSSPSSSPFKLKKIKIWRKILSLL